MKNIYLKFLSKYLYNKFQPIISLKDKKIFALEVLTRLKYRNREYSAYEIFSQSTHDVKNYIAKRNILQICKMQKNEHIIKSDISLTLNLSSHDINNGSTKFLRKLIQRGSLNPKKIIIEITEDIEMDKKTITHIKLLKKMGVKFAIDDFGNGYSTFNYFIADDTDKDTIFDYVKLDSVLIHNIEVNKSKRLILKGIIDIAKNNNMEIITEHIDNFDNLSIMQKYGADFVQGFLFTKPLKERETIKYIKNQTNIQNIVSFGEMYKSDSFNLSEMILHENYNNDFEL